GTCRGPERMDRARSAGEREDGRRDRARNDGLEAEPLEGVAQGACKDTQVVGEHPERIVPDETEPGIVALHRKRYEFAAPACAGKQVLDAGCGVGYGSACLARSAAHVVGVDVDANAVAYARRRYGAANVEFEV